MEMNKYVSILLSLLLLCSCSSDSKNREMIEFVRSQEHDPRLVGWWESIPDAEELFYYDGNTFEKLSFIIESDGTLVEYGPGTYWYTKDDVLYFMKKATVLTGVITANVDYRISDDNNYLLMKGTDGAFEPSRRRIDVPEGYNPRK